MSSHTTAFGRQAPSEAPNTEFTGLGVAATRFAAEVMLDRLAGDDASRFGWRWCVRRPLPFPPDPSRRSERQNGLDRSDHREGRRNLMFRRLDHPGLELDS
jgi:hypothetical protein